MTQFMSNSLFFGAAISLIAYEAGLLLKRKFKMAIFNPLLIAIIAVIAVSYTHLDVYKRQLEKKYFDVNLRG